MTVQSETRDHRWLHWLVQSLLYKCVHNESSNGGPDAALECASDGGLNAELKLAP